MSKRVRKPVRPARAEVVAWLDAMRPPGRVFVEHPERGTQETVFICATEDIAKRRQDYVRAAYGNAERVEFAGKWYVTRIVETPKEKPHVHFWKVIGTGGEYLAVCDCGATKP